MKRLKNSLRDWKGRSLWVLAAVALLLTLTVGGSVAYIITRTDTVSNSFASGLTPVGTLSIRKTVTHPFGDSYIVPDNDNTTFTFDVDLGIDNAGGVFGDYTANQSGVVTLNVKAGQTVSLSDIPEGTQATVSERDDHDGFTVQADQTVTVRYENTPVVVFENPYTPAEADNDLSLTGSVALEGRDWQEGDSFTVVLERYINGEWVELDRVVETPEFDDDGSLLEDPLPYDFTGTLRNASLDEAGTHSFRVRELQENLLPGVTYDPGIGQFDVTVGDADMDGKLEIQQVSINRSIIRLDPQDNFHVIVDFVNRYAPEGSATLDISITKTLTDNTGAGRSPEGFSFELKEGDNVIATSDDTNAVGETGIHLTYTPDKAGEHYVYVLRECRTQEPGIGWDEREITLDVWVEDNNDGTVSALVSDDGTKAAAEVGAYAAAFENSYSATPASMSLSGEKTLTGRALQNGDFAFDLYQTGADFDVSNGGTLIDSARNDANGAFAFDSVTLDHVGTFYYVVRENSDDALTGVTYDQRLYLVTAEVTDSNAELSANITVRNQAGNDVQDIVFENSYTPQPASFTLSAEKVLDGRELAENEFSFSLYPADSSFEVTAQAVQRVHNAADGQISFDAITLRDAGVYYYVLQEDRGTLPGIGYDGTVYHITVTVTDDGFGALRAETALVKAVDGAEEDVDRIVFTNTYSSQYATLTLEGSKKLNGAVMDAGQFRFLLYRTDDAFNPEAEAADQTYNERTGAFRFQTLTFTEAGTYRFLVREDTGTPLPGISYDEAVYRVTVTVTDDGRGSLQTHTEYVRSDAQGAEGAQRIQFTNSYSAAYATLHLDGKKTLKRAKLRAGQFKFLLYSTNSSFKPQGDPVDTVTQDAKGAIHFNALTFTAPGTYYYLAQEDERDVPAGYYCDDVRYRITVTVTDDGSGSLQASPKIIRVKDGKQTMTASLQFENTYSPDYATLALTAVKKLQGATLKAGQFTFELYSADSAFKTAGKPLQTVKNRADGKVVFQTRTFNKAGTYYFVVREKTGNQSGVTYDDAVYRVTVTVKDGGKGKLNAKADYTCLRSGKTTQASSMVFNNRYTKDHVNVEVKAKVAYPGRDITAGQFKVQIYKADKDYNAEKDPLDQAYTDSNGMIQFKDLTFSEPGTYYYVVQQDTSDQSSDVIYDTTRYGVCVVVTRNANGELEYSVKMHKIGGGEVDELKFVNTYKTSGGNKSGSGTTNYGTDDGKGDVRTGDDGRMLQWLCLLVGSAVGLLLLVVIDRKRSRDKKNDNDS